MSNIVSILPCVIGKGDPRWLEFGLKRPRPEDTTDRRLLNNHAVPAEPILLDFRPGEQPVRSGHAAA